MKIQLLAVIIAATLTYGCGEKSKPESVKKPIKKAIEEVKKEKVTLFPTLINKKVSAVSVTVKPIKQKPKKRKVDLRVYAEYKACKKRIKEVSKMVKGFSKLDLCKVCPEYARAKKIYNSAKQSYDSANKEMKAVKKQYNNLNPKKKRIGFRWVNHSDKTTVNKMSRLPERRKGSHDRVRYVYGYDQSEVARKSQLKSKISKMQKNLKKLNRAKEQAGRAKLNAHSMFKLKLKKEYSELKAKKKELKRRM